MFSSDVSAFVYRAGAVGINSPFPSAEVLDAAWREGLDLLFALRVSEAGYVFEAINPAFETRTGLLFDEVVGRSIASVLPPKWAETLAIRCDECLSEARPVRYVEALPLPSGRWHWDTTLTSVLTTDGQTRLILGSAREVNDSLEAQIARFGGSGWDATDPDAGPTIHFTAYSDGRPDRVCRNFFEFTGVEFGATGARVALAIHPEDLPRLVPDGGDSAQDRAYLADIRIRRWDGAYRTFRLRSELTDGLSGRRWYGVASDLGRLETAERRSVLSAGRENLVHAGRWLEFHVHPAADEVVLMFWDVTDRHRAQEAVDAVRELVQGLSDASGGEMALLSEDGLIASVNAAFRMLVDPPAHDCELIGRSYLDVCRSLIPTLDQVALRRGLRELFVGRIQSYSQAYVIESPAGMRWRQLRLTPMQVGATPHFVAVHEDLTDIARDNAARQNRTEQVLSAQEAERQRIAIELHDSTMQHLVALDMGVARLRRLLRNDGGADDVLDDMSKAAQEALKEIRILSYLMKPQASSSLELLVRRFVQGFGRRANYNTSFRAQGPVDAVSDAVRHAAFRIVQAALSNVYRHAEAQGVEVELTNREGVLTVRIADDGKGMPSLERAEAEGVSLGVGIPGMQARVAQLGGKLSVGGDGAGTVVTAILPAHQHPTGGRIPA